MSETDRDIFLNIIQQVERLAIFGYSSAKFQENEAKKLVIKSFKWPSSLRHLESSTEDGGRSAKNSFDLKFVERIHKAWFEQRVI